MFQKLGIGIDLVDINKFKKLPYENNKNFYEKIFNTNEIEYCLQFSNPYEHFAGKFGIKEAVIKSINRKIHMKFINTTHKNKKPQVQIDGISEYVFKISVTHESDYAIAIVISEKL